MSARQRMLFRCLAIVAVSVASVGAQTLNPPPPIRATARWDSTNQVLFFFDVFTSSPDGILRSYFDGAPRGVDIHILKDFPSAEHIHVHAVSAGPDGSTIAAVQVLYARNVDRHLMLTYDALGRLVNSWDLLEQESGEWEEIAYSKDDDAIFVLGDSDIQLGPDPDVDALLVEYDRNGRVLKSMLPDSLFGEDGAFSGSSQMGEPEILVTPDRIFAYFPTDMTAAVCDRKGAILARRSLSDAVAKYANKNGYVLDLVRRVAFGDSGDILFDLVISKNPQDYFVDLICIHISTGELSSVHRIPQPAELLFVGVKDGKYLFQRGRQSLVANPWN